MRRRLLYYKQEIDDGIPPFPLKVVFHSTKDSKLILVEAEGLTAQDYLMKFPKDIYTPIGIVVVPGEHGILKDGRDVNTNHMGVMSLVNMDPNNPEKGTNSNPKVSWGYYRLNIDSLSDDNYVVYVDPSKPTKKKGHITISRSLEFPHQDNAGETPKWSEGVTYHIPSPFASTNMCGGSFNSVISE